VVRSGMRTAADDFGVRYGPMEFDHDVRRWRMPSMKWFRPVAGPVGRR
jgi:hypothetical protein